MQNTTKSGAIDMFTGIGGLGALLPVRPVVYVESGDFQTHILKTRMRSDSLGVAVIHDDAYTVTQEAGLLQGAEYIIAGFPCQSLSSIGKRHGLWHGGNTASSAFFCIIQVAVEFALPRLFLENVEGLLQQRKHWSVIYSSLHDAGYDVHWTVLGACHLGAPHKRHRWFALCIRRHQPCHASSICLPVCESLFRSGRMVNGLFSEMRPIDCPQPSKVLGMTLFNTPIKRWFTPRTNDYASGRHTITGKNSRSLNDLGTQVRFASSTADTLRQNGRVLNPCWVEWLMGFPRGWTDPRCDSQLIIQPNFNWGDNHENCIPPLLTQQEMGSRSDISLIHKRNRALGNACVPQCARFAWDILHKSLNHEFQGESNPAPFVDSAAQI